LAERRAPAKCVSFFARLASRMLRGPFTGPAYKQYEPALAEVKAEWTKIEQLAPQLLRPPQTLAERFAFACAAAERVLGMRVFDVQILGALAMNDGHIAEMQTGEGKTLTAVLTVYANAVDGHGAHVWTANDYLAKRDAEWMAGIYEQLGLRTGYVTQGMSAGQRRAAYACDVTYATANEVGFDYLRDQLVLEPDQLVQRPFSFVLIDEADSILIDEARIPLVIAGGSATPEGIEYVMARLVASFSRGLDFSIDENARNVQPTDRGIAKVEALFGCGNLYEPQNETILTAVQNALHAHFLLRRDVDYVVKHGSVELVDEFKGRIAQDRRWPASLQTAIEAKERVPLKKQGRILGSITLQNLAAQYPRICGMTGTAATQAEEFRTVYRLEVVPIPTNRPVIRSDQPDIIFADKLSKERAVVREIAKVHAAGRPVLVGTASVEESERLSERARQAGIPHSVLNARNDEHEAHVIAHAGEIGAVTISTNMAGRGTDIPLGGDAVRELGGLYVIGTNKHESRRIDNQLRGRAGRQGDPGSSRFFISVDDDLLQRYGIGDAFKPGEDAQAAVDHVQRIVEGQNLEIRKTLWKYEGLTEQHRRELAERRRSVLYRESASVVEVRDPELWTNLCERWGEARIKHVERAVTLAKIDDIWADYLAAIAELRGGIHWVSWAGHDPLHSYLVRATEIFEDATRRIDDEVIEALGDDAVVESGGVPATFERGATWTYLINDQPFGTLQERWAKSMKATLRAVIGR
jgi:preprotein translocase subunit SecA